MEAVDDRIKWRCGVAGVAGIAHELPGVNGESLTSGQHVYEPITLNR